MAMPQRDNTIEASKRREPPSRANNRTCYLWLTYGKLAPDGVLMVLGIRESYLFSGEVKWFS